MSVASELEKRAFHLNSTARVDLLGGLGEIWELDLVVLIVLHLTEAQ